MIWLSTWMVAAQTIRFSVIGDYGTDGAGQRAVAELIKTNFQPEFIVTVGDNNYLGEMEIDRAIGKYYSDFIGNYVGSYGTGAVSNRFFPALGNHDYYGANGYAAHTNYFTLPGNERYYDFVRGSVHFFIVNSDSHEPDGTSPDSVQGRWLSNRLAASTSPWKLVVSQDPPFSSTSPDERMRWPFREWNADLVLSGHAHQYERIVRAGMTYVVNGAGGAGLVGFGTTTEGSAVRYNADHGAMLITATHATMVAEFWSVAEGGELIDQFVLSASPALLSAAVSNGMVRLTWPTNGTQNAVLQHSASLGPSAIWSNVMAIPQLSGAMHVVTRPVNQPREFFRLHISN